jgi:hypothetical protein
VRIIIAAGLAGPSVFMPALGLAALLGWFAAIGNAAAAPSEDLKACVETASRCRQRCQGKASCEAACQKSFKQCKLWDTETRPDHPRDSVMPR